MFVALYRGCPSLGAIARVLSSLALVSMVACGHEQAPSAPAVAARALTQGCSCGDGSWTFVDQGTDTAYNLVGRSLCIDSGVFTGSLELDATSSICVDDDAAMLTAQALNMGGRLENHGVVGSLVTPLAFTALAGTVFDNHGAMYIGTANFNGPATITNAVDATLDFTTSFSLRNGSTMTNLGTFRAVSNFDTSLDSVFLNEGYGYITGQLSFEGTSDNKGLLEITAKVNVNGTATFANTCTIVSHGTYNVSGTYLNDGMVYLHADTEDLHFNVTGGGHMTQGEQGQVFVTSLDGIGGLLAANLRVDGSIVGQGLLYVEDETVCQGAGIVSGSADSPITLFDATPTIDQICDIETGVLEHVIRGAAPAVPALATAQLGITGSDCRTLVALHCHDDKPPTEVDTGCDETRPWCDTSGEVRRCVACFEDADCGGDRLCLDGLCQNPDPLAVGDTIRVGEGGSVTVTAAELVANDQFVAVATAMLDGGVTSLVTPAGGSVVHGPDGFTYTPPTSPPAIDTFLYVVCGVGTAASDCVGATVTVLINRRPVPDDARVWVAVGTETVTVDLIPLFDDPDGDGPADDVGVEVFAVPEPLEPGIQTVSYIVCDDGLPSACGAGDVRIYVNDPPTLADLDVVGGADQTITVPLDDVIVGTGVLEGDDPDDGDDDGIGFVDVSGPCALADSGDIVVATAASPGSAVCTVTVCEEVPPEDPRVCAESTITVRTAAPPLASDDVYWGLMGIPLAGRVTTNDTIDPAGTASVVVLGPLPNVLTQGSVTAVGEFVTFTPVASFAGQVALVYELHDGLGQVATATVTFIVNDPPVLDGPEVELPPGGTATIPLDDIIVGTGVVHGDDPTDGDDDGIGTITVTTGTGLCTIVGDGLVLDAPDSPGRFTCQLRVCEERPVGACTTTPVTIFVPGADLPVATDDAYYGAQGSPLGGDVAINDTVDTVHGGAAAVTVLGPTPNPTTEGVITTVGTIVTFTPVASFAGELEVVYRLSDGLGQSDTATITFVVNDPPSLDDPELEVPGGDEVEVPLDDIIVDTGVVHGDDPTDGDDDGIGTVTVTDGPCTLDGDVLVVVTPAADPAGPTSIVCTVRVCEELPLAAAGVCAETTVTLVVPELPQASDDTATTPEDTAVTIVVGTNDDPGLEVTTITDAPDHGTVVIDESGTITYTPGADYHGPDTFEYEACDDAGVCDTATVVVTTTPEPDAPIAADDNASTKPSVTVTIDFLANDVDPDGDALTVTAVTTPAHGTVGTDGVYVPEPGYRGTVTFEYTVCDTTERCDTATVTVTIADNGTPIGGDDDVDVGEDGSVVIPVLDNDGDPDGDEIDVGEVGEPEHGTVEVDEDGNITYTPDPDFSGEDTFTYEVCDAEGACADVTVTVTVTPVADPPVAIDDTYTTPYETPLTFDVRTNDYDVDGDALVVSTFTAATSGTVTLGSDGRFTFTPAAQMSGEVTFTYVIADASGLTDGATVTIVVGQDLDPNDAPEAVDDAVTVPGDEGTVIDVTTNDSDPDGDELVVVDVTQPEHGTVTIDEDGTITYTPDDGFEGTDTFTYTVSDGQGGTDSATVTITVEAPEDPDSGFAGLVAEGGGGCAGGAGVGGVGATGLALVLAMVALALRRRRAHG